MVSSCGGSGNECMGFIKYRNFLDHLKKLCSKERLCHMELVT